jgi:hypothetical protein
MKLRTANTNARHKRRALVSIAAWTYDLNRTIRLARSGTMHKRINSGYVLRQRQRDRKMFK